MIYHWAYTTIQTDASHLELLLRNVMCQQALGEVNALATYLVSTAIA